LKKKDPKILKKKSFFSINKFRILKKRSKYFIVNLGLKLKN